MRLTMDMPHAFIYLLEDEDGTSLMEYALIGALITVVCMLALLALTK